MGRRTRSVLVFVPALAVGCSANPDRRTIAQLQSVQPDVEEVRVQDALDLAMQSYRQFLEQTPSSAMTPEAMRRLADLQIEKEFGITGDGGTWFEMQAPEPGATPPDVQAQATRGARDADRAAPLESDADFERRTTAEHQFEPASLDLELPGGESVGQGGPLEAIAIYEQLLAEYPSYERADHVLYQMARAYDELGRTEEAMEVMERLIAEHGYSKYFDEVQFRRGEYFFTRRAYRQAEDAYQAITARSANSEFFELAVYKLGWSLYKQEFYEEALHQYMALLDYKLSIGYDFDQAHEEDDERRVADTFRVISLSFSNLGGPEVLEEYYSMYGRRSYEDRIYQNLGEFYFDKLRYNDAAAVYGSFVDRYPSHYVSPRFSMRVIEIYAAGGFPMLVVESKKEFATKYGLQGEYWKHFAAAERPDVLNDLKTNLTDLANHYHALYQEPSLEEEKPANYAEALVWYREFLASFPQDPESPDINYQLADLLLENRDYAQAAREYERTAYEYPAHERAPAAGYAAIFAHREHVRMASADEEETARRATVASSLRFADVFPEHEHAPAVLGAAAEDLYSMAEFRAATTAARMFLERYPTASAALMRSAWTVTAHSSLELSDYAGAEHAYTRVLALTPPDDDIRQTLIENLAASIYKQGEQANGAEDYRAAAAHFLRIKDAAPSSAIRPAAEYDAASALMRAEDWSAAATVLDGFRKAFPEHELGQEATKQLAFVYQEGGELALAAGEYERVARESADPDLRREALLAAGDLHEQAGTTDSAIAVYAQYVNEFPRPVEIAVETRFKLAQMYEARGEGSRRREQLEAIVAADSAAGTERTDRTRYLAAQSALVLAEPLYRSFAEVQLVQPFERSLALKRERMDTAMDAFERLINYEVGEVTAAATFYMAEVYDGFSRSLLESERPAGLDASELGEYEEVIEEEAFPFEELAIEVHEKNVELISAGIYNNWIEKSLARLAVLVPGRYAKEEQSIGMLGSIDTFTYVSPGRSGGETNDEIAEFPATRRRRGSSKNPKSRLEIVEGMGFQIIEEARIGTDVRARYETAVGNLEQGLHEPGIALLVELTSDAPDLANPHIELGLAYARVGDLSGAAASLERAVELGAAHPIVMNELGLIYRRQGRFGPARESYEKAIAAYPDFHLARRNLAILCDLYLRDLSCALEHYEAYVRIVPDDREAAIWVADIRSRANP